MAALTDVAAGGGFIAITNTTPTVIVTGPTDPARTLIVRGLVVCNVDNASSPSVSLGWNTAGGTITDSAAQHFVHNRPIVDELPIEITNIPGAATAIRIYIVSALVTGGVNVKWAEFEVLET